MSLRILCSGNIVRYPVGGFTWHHLQYLAGLGRSGHEVVYLEHYGWPSSCYDPSLDLMTSDPSYGVAYLDDVLAACGLNVPWCYLAEDGTTWGMPRDRLGEWCSACDLYIGLSNINWIPELESCRRRVLVDTDPVFTQISVLGMPRRLTDYHTLFTFGENVHRQGCTMPTAGLRWLPTRQPVVVDLWPVDAGDPSGPFTTVTSWEPIGDQYYDGKVAGGKAREFEPFFGLPRETGEAMELAVSLERKYCDSEAVRRRMTDGGWRVIDPIGVSRTPWDYQRYLSGSRAEFSVAKHGYVSTQCGWFSERSAAYLASGRPVVVQDTGFGRFLPCGMGLLAYRDPGEATRAIRNLGRDYEAHCRTARAVAEEYFDARAVLTDLLQLSL